jgi:hypothetical protein
MLRNKRSRGFWFGSMNSGTLPIFFAQRYCNNHRNGIKVSIVASVFVTVVSRESGQSRRVVGTTLFATRITVTWVCLGEGAFVKEFVANRSAQVDVVGSVCFSRSVAKGRRWSDGGIVRHGR